VVKIISIALPCYMLKNLKMYDYNLYLACMYTVGYDELLLLWIMQSRDNTCSSFLKLWLGLIIIIIIIFLHGLGRLTCSGIDSLPLFPRASTISSSSRFVVEGVFRKSGVVHSFKMVDPVLFVFGSHVLYSRDL